VAALTCELRPKLKPWGRRAQGFGRVSPHPFWPWAPMGLDIREEGELLSSDGGGEMVRVLTLQFPRHLRFVRRVPFFVENRGLRLRLLGFRKQSSCLSFGRGMESIRTWLGLIHF
jgi:hypothetical protein